MTPAIYSGEVVHQRFAPKPHRLRYHIFQLLLDLDRPVTTRLFSHNRFNLFSFHDADHGPDQADTCAPLKVRVRSLLAESGLCHAGDRLFLLAMPRVLGFVFNPISLYFVQKADGGIRCVVYEVNNTFGDRHTYVLPVRDAGPRIRQHSDKKLHVSPFMDMDMAYAFDLKAPGDTFMLNIRLSRHGADMLFAGFTARRRPLSDGVLLRLFAAMPFMTIKVVLGIHWEALRIWLKGIRLRRKPPTPRSSVSV